MLGVTFKLKNMKKILILLLLLNYNFTYSETFIINNKIIEGNLIYSSDSCSIIESVDDNGNPLFWILAEVATALLPEAGRFICLKTIGEENGGEEICENVANGINFITTVVDTGKRSFKFLSEIVECTAERNLQKSGLTFISKSFDFAVGIKNTLEAYKKLNIINWENIKKDNVVTNYVKSFTGHLKIRNNTISSKTFQISQDGIKWIEITINSGFSRLIKIWDGSVQQNYVLIKSNDFCEKQLIVNKEYNINLNKYTNEIEFKLYR